MHVGLTKEKLAIFALTLALIAVSSMYIQSLTTIEKMYTNSVIESLESEIRNTALVGLNDTTTTTTTTPNEITTPEPTTPVVPITYPPEITNPPAPEVGCRIDGCSGQLCVSADAEPLATTCEWREEYACYQAPVGVCERQTTGQCGWTDTEELRSCLINSTDNYETEDTYPDAMEVI